MANQDDNNNQEIEKVEDVEVETTKNTSDTDNKKQNNDDGYEKVCFICRRPEIKAGKMIDIPGGIHVCMDCMQKSFNSMNQQFNEGKFNYSDLLNMPNVSMIDLSSFQNPVQQPKKEKKKKKHKRQKSFAARSSVWFQTTG